MKKLAVIFCILFIVFSLTGCSPTEPSSEPDEQGSESAWLTQQEAKTIIDEIINRLNSNAITEDEAIEEIISSIPKPPDYPKRTIEYIVPSGEGGGSDTYARMIGKDMQRITGVPLIFNNMPGAGGQVALSHFLSIVPDGYTIYGSWSAQIIQDGLGTYENTVVKDLQPIIANQGATEVFVVRDDSPFKTWEDMMEYAKANPGKLKVVGAGAMGDDEINIGYLNHTFDMDIVYVPFDKQGERVTSLLGGHVDAFYATVGTIIDLITSKQIRPLLIVAPTRWPDFDPDLRCSADVDIEFPITRFRGMWTHKETDPKVVDYLHNVFYACSQLPSYKEYEKLNMMDVSDGYLSAEDYGNHSKQVVEKLKPILKELGYTEE